MPEQDDPPQRTMTTAMLKAFANPLRRDMMRVFARREFIRAADIAEELGEPANKISFHLRVMADAGLIVEAPEKARDGRDRVWTPIREALSVGTPDDPVADEALGNVVIAALAEDHDKLVRRIVAYSIEAMSGRDRGIGIHGTLSVHHLRLTEQEFTALHTVLSRTIGEAEAAHDPTSPDSRLWEIDIVAGDETI
ncbi:helix-turn-helix domain-containing protein [Microbacterium sp. NPDC058342]|uniref:helix-turn-helix domain-containing protein n=1 Tax=Microbacterium sp. NPDC058342 TaxID=3346454 RepID=UPI003666312B